VIIATQIEYQKSSKQDKSKLLDSIKLITKRDRKHLIRLMNENLQDLQQAKRSGVSRDLKWNQSLKIQGGAVGWFILNRKTRIRNLLRPHRGA
jgi:hypothetical protein